MKSSYLFPRLLLGLSFVALPLQAGPTISVKDIKGRAVEIELLSANANSVRFRRANNPQEFTLGLDQFDADSQAKIKAAAVALPPVLPPLEADVVIGKRREKGDSYYMVEQQISSTVKLHNLSHDTPLPKLTGKVIFVGRNQRKPDDYTVLSVQEFPVELKPGENTTTVLQPFVTSYDSDNKGAGNVGGYQYSGYLMIFLNDKKEVVFDQTTDAGIRKSIQSNAKLLAAVAKYTKGAYLNDKMVIQNANLRPPVLSN